MRVRRRRRTRRHRSHRHRQRRCCLRRPRTPVRPKHRRLPPRRRPTRPHPSPAPIAPPSDSPPKIERAAPAMPPLAPTQTAQVSGTRCRTRPRLFPRCRPPPPSSPAPNSQTPGAQLPGEPTQRSQPDVEAPNAQAPNLRTADVETVRNDVFGLAASGGAVKALDEGTARCVLRRRHRATGRTVDSPAGARGRDKSRSMTATASTDRQRCARQTTSTSGYRPRPSTRRSGLRSRATGRSPRHAAT